MTDRRPDISVLIPTFNRRDVVLRVVAAIDRQTLAPEQMEVVVIDDGSKDGTTEAIRAAAPAMAVRVVCEYQPNAGASVARNRAIDMARGRILLIINDDTIATPGMLAAHLRLHEDEPAPEVAALGRLAIPPELPDSIFVHLHHAGYLDDLPDRTDLGWRHFMTFNISAKASLLRESGGFDPALGWHEDDELGLRLSHKGLRVLLAKDAVGYHYHPMDEAKYLRIAERDGEALGQLYKRSPELLPHLIEMGLHSAHAGTRAMRHRVADLAINQATWPLWIGLARSLIGPRPELAKRLYERLFQWRKRRAIDAVLAAG
jgi:GT2 family glycosyltransferase